MFGPGVKSGWRVRPKRIASIRDGAELARKVLLPKQLGFFPMGPFIERLSEFGIVVDIVERDLLPRGVDACCIPEAREITLAEDVYKRACKDVPHDCFTVIHELGHLLLGHSRSFHRDDGRPIKPYEDSEWQANQFAAEFLMPLRHMRAKGFQTPDELVLEFNVSEPAAVVRIGQLKKRGEI